MAVFSTNLIVYTHTDFEQTFLLEDNQSNSAKDLTGFSGTARFKRQFEERYGKEEDLLEQVQELLGLELMTL